MLVINEDDVTGQFISARNRLRQYDFLETAFRVWSDGHALDVDHRFICETNFYATQYLSHAPGTYRHLIQANVVINGAKHVPPPWEDVERHMIEFLERLQRYLQEGSPIEAAAYALWRLNWIHPFVQGNGRCARAVSYFVLCRKLKLWLPGTPTIPEQIRSRRPEYCTALEACDARATSDGSADLSPMIDLLNEMLGKQLAS